MTHAEAVAFFSALFGGEHHIPGPKRLYNGERVRPWGGGWYVTTPEDLATYDRDLLTRLVFAAHDAGYRAEVNSAMRDLRITIFKRGREGGINERHPTLEQAVAGWREKHQAPGVDLDLERVRGMLGGVR